MSEAKPLGVMKPTGGGDPIPLKKPEMVVGRRPSCDIRLDFENVSGKHCALQFINGTWHVRDLGSTNGTTVNGHKISNQQGILPDDEIGIASHLFSIDYEPANPAMASQQLLEEEMATERAHRPKSLMELAGLASEDRARPPDPSRSKPRSQQDEFPTNSKPSTSTSEPADDFDEAPVSSISTSAPLEDDDFFKFIEEDVKKQQDRS